MIPSDSRDSLVIPGDSLVIPKQGLRFSQFHLYRWNQESDSESWLLRELVDSGFRTGRGGWRDCHLSTHSCKRQVLIGLDAPALALTAIVEPIALSPLGEVCALSEGLRTYLFMRGELTHRDHWNVAGMPASTHNRVLPQHRCAWLIPDTWQAAKPVPQAAAF